VIVHTLFDSFFLEIMRRSYRVSLNFSREVTVTKTNGTSYQFHLMVSSRIPTGAFHIGRIDVRKKNYQPSLFYYDIIVLVFVYYRVVGVASISGTIIVSKL
jgi:hypothetical protein